jgi:hypothetical protein
LAPGATFLLDDFESKRDTTFTGTGAEAFLAVADDDRDFFTDPVIFLVEPPEDLDFFTRSAAFLEPTAAADGDFFTGAAVFWAASAAKDGDFFFTPPPPVAD